MDEKKQVALVTGAARGIGRAIAVALAESGRHVIINFRSRTDAAEETLKQIEALGGAGELAPFDVSDDPAVTHAIEDILERHARVDVLVHNAGIRDDKLLVWMEPPSWHKVVDTSLDAFYYVTRPLLKPMLMNRHGRIVCIASTSGQTGIEGQVNYSAAKAGLIGAAKALSREVAKRNVTVNVVAPGFIDTDMLDGLPKDELAKRIPMGRVGTVDEIAGVVVFLCSPATSYMTGQVLGVNGGIC